MAISNLNAENKANAEKGLPTYLKVCLLVVAAAFLAYSSYWAIKAPFTLYELIGFFSSRLFLDLTMNHPFALPLIALQEFAATIGLFVNLIAAILAFKCTILFIKKDKRWVKTLGKALLVEAFWFILLIPIVIHNFVGVVLSINTANFYVGLSYLLQVLLIAPPFIMLVII